MSYINIFQDGTCARGRPVYLLKVEGGKGKDDLHPTLFLGPDCKTKTD